MVNVNYQVRQGAFHHHDDGRRLVEMGAVDELPVEDSTDADTSVVNVYECPECHDRVTIGINTQTRVTGIAE